ncbi:hypothetical protein P8C59_005456 [Phyllachora maydis]|uniref:Integrase catalytic domain-containing protein n=1 Tax=Phyllachora maydis TaxID=1825666 RepID=A0AAD9I4B6_9PEZI|nr:hypothetical protein P8C59_005456 [Phyllachora maydis]
MFDKTIYYNGQLRPINTGNGPVSPASIGSITLEVLSRKAPPTYTKLVLDNVLYLPNIDINIVSGVRHYNSGGCLIKETLYRGDRRCIAILDFKKSGFFLDVKGSSKPILHANFAFPLGLTSYNTTKSIEPQRNKIVVEIPSNSIRKEDYRPIIEDAIVSEAIEPNKRYKLRNSPAKGTTLEGAPYQSPRKTREPKPLTGTGDLPRVLREPVIEENKVVEKAISSPTLKEPNIGQRDYYNLLNSAKLWHVRLGHIGLRLLKKTSSITKGLPNFDKIKEADFHCSSYDRGKAVRRVSKALIPDPPRVLDLIEGDTVKIRPRPYNRNPIVLLLVNRKSRYRWVFNLPNKSGPIVANAIKGFFRGLRNGFGRYPTKFHFDGGTEITDLLTTWLAKKGIKFSTSAPYIHEQNGLVERSVRVILDRVRYTILSSALPQYLWCFILEAVVELVNSTAITNKETTPFQALFDELEPGIPHIPNLERYRAIGARGEAIIPLEKRSKSLKFTSRTKECKLLAVLGSKTYLVYIPSRRAVLKTSTVKFIEDNTVLSQPTDNTALEGELVDLDLDLEGAVSPDPSNLNTEKPISIEIGPSKLEPYESSSDSELDKPLPDKPINPVIVESTRPTISIRKPELPEPLTNEPLDNSDLISEGDKMQLDYYKLLAKTSSYILSFIYKARKRVISKDSTPTTYKQVLKLPRDERSKWLEAITKEFIQLLELGVFKFLPRSLLPLNRKLITCRNVLKVKKDAKNRPIKYKSRLVARGFIQVEGLDYTITYASTKQADFIRAFFNSALREEIYMEIPKGLLDLAASNKAIYKLLLKYGYNPSTPNIIKLSKALYSLKQSPREWQDKLKILLKSLGYLPLISDPEVFYNAKTCYFIVTYIDNCLFIGPNIGYITDLKKRLNKVYAIEDLGPAAYFLGYIEEAVSRFNLADSKPISIPLQPGLVSQLQLEEDITSYLCNSTEIKLYQSLVGTAMYIMLLTRVDISFTVQWLSRSLNRPTKSHLNAAKNLFKYLNSTKDYSICFSYNGNTVADLGPKLSNSSNTTTKLSRDFHSKEGPRPLTTTSTTIVDSRNSKGSSRTSIINSSLVPIGFSDSDFAGDKATSKSTYGYLYKLAGRPISWKTKRATTIALSTLEAETDGLIEAIREVQWIIGLFSELHRPIDYPITLYGDNQGSITVANDPALYARTKHTLLKFRYVREQVRAKIVTIIYLNTKSVLGSKTYLVYTLSSRAVLKTSTIKFIEDNTVLSQPTDKTALEGELVDLDLDLKGAVSPDPSNLNTEKPISIEIGPSKLEPYESSSDSELDKPLPDKPINPVIVESTRPTISIRKPKLLEAFPLTIEPIFAPKPIEVIVPNQPITNEPLNNSNLILEGDKIQLDYYKLLAKTKLGVFKFLPRSLLPSNRKLIPYRNVLKVKKDAKNRPIKYKSQLVARGFIQVYGLDYTITYASTRAFLNSALREEIYIEIPEGLLDLAASNKAIYKLLLKYGYNPSTPNIIKLSKALYSLKQSPREWQDKLKILLKSLGYLPLISDPGVFYNAKTCHFIVTYIDDCLFIGPNIGYITDLKKRLNKVYAIEDLGPAAYFLGYIEEAVSRFNLADSKPISIPLQLGLVSQLQLEEDITSHLYNSTEIKLYQSLVGTAIYIMLLTRVDISFIVQWLSRSLNRPTKSHLNAAKNLFKYLNSTKDYSICFSYNGNTVADLGPKLSNSSHITTKLSRDFHSKEGPRPLTTTSTTIVDSRNSKGSSRTSIINSSLVLIGFSNSDFAGDKATSKSTYGYLYKLAGRPISWKTKRATTIALSTLKAKTNGLTEAIREVQWIIGLFSELYRPIDHPITLYRDNQGSITVANDPALHARTKHTLLKFRYVREQVKAKIVTIIYLNTKFNSTGYFTAL